MRNNLVIKYNDTLLFFLLGIFCFGGAIGRIYMGLSIFDLLLGITFLRSFFKNKLSNSALFFLIILCLGIISTLIGIIFTEVRYSYFLTEFRFYFYIPMYCQVIKNSKFNNELINKYFRVLLILYLIIYVFLLEPGGFVFQVFNSIRSDLALDFVGRILGPQVIFLSIVFFITLNSSKKINTLNTFLYSILIIIIYVKTGERTVFLTNILPIAWIIYEKRNIWMLSVIPILTTVIPLYINETQIKRFKRILNPLDDPAFIYRVENVRVMIFENMSQSIHSFFLGMGFGSVYRAKVFTHPVESYFLDNSFVMLVYKLGIPVALFFLIYLYSRCWKLNLIQKVYLIIFITIPAVTSYHLILQPAYILSYFFAIKILNKKKNHNESYPFVS
ncbi:hypothetical protein KLA_04217 [Cellulophaga geojensis KL-A]|uniref:O-antigen polymerase n=1 Tax=Cellulophaga geojensis KL-A TaxID=1328323 RepID=A0ABN0RRQ5_9FLAO|nr:hypothetical protein [Cellulophaga geojensis]EWH14541.1 hypothetical protein KLA_04217 [Cellulophaga geojensis KL-A]